MNRILSLLCFAAFAVIALLPAPAAAATGFEKLPGEQG